MKKSAESAESGSSGAGAPLPPALSRAIRDIVNWAAGHDYPAALVGAVAVSLHGAARPTDDVDLLLLSTDAPGRMLASLQASGFEPRFPDPIAFAEDARVLLVRHVESGVDVDIMLGLLPFEHDCVARSEVRHTSFGQIRIARPEALCVMKLIAGRPHDLRDAAQLLEAYPELDRAWVLEQIRQIAELMESAEYLERARNWSRARGEQGPSS
jgi:hypothetical protein